MERGSDKHSAVHDDVLKHELQGLRRSGHSTRTQEWREPEPSGDDQPEVSRAPGEHLAGGTPPGMTQVDIDGRSDLARYLSRQTWPAGRETLVQLAAEQHAPDRVLQQLSGLPANERFENVSDVWTTLGGGVERGRF